MTKIYTDCMLDWETLSLLPHTVVTEVGYTFFNRNELHGFNDGDNHVSIMEKIDIWSQINNKRNVDPITVQWCKDNADFPDMISGTTNVIDVLKTFNKNWDIYANDHTQFWANGPDFDKCILDNLCRQYQIDIKPKHSNVQSFRTAMLLSSEVERVKPNNAHNALSDAIAQAKTIQKVFAENAALKDDAWKYNDLNK